MKEASARQISTLFNRATKEGDWDLCKELARFLVGIDETGNLLKTVLYKAELRDSRPHDSYSSSDEGPTEPSQEIDHTNGVTVQISDRSARNGSNGSIINAGHHQGRAAQDYFADPARYE
jgi:hypothetical protein